MKTIDLEYYGYNVEVEYELEDDLIDISDWRFESEEPLEELNLYDERACAIFEDELREMIAGHMAKQKEAQKWITPYKATQNRRMYNNQ